MVRAGLIRQLGAGLWTYLPAGWRAHRKVEAVIREEMEGIGCQEMLMPVVTPADRIAIDLELDPHTAARKVRALTAQATQTAGLIATLGADRYTAWVGVESFNTA